MVGSVSGGASGIDYNPTSMTDAVSGGVQAKVQVAVLKMQQDQMRMEGQEMAQLMEPHKGGNVDAYA